MTSPYADTAGQYWAAGWRGILPLPENAKGPVPRGFTGWAGVEPSWPDISAWIEGGTGGPRGYAAGNIALRLPRGVYGLDVDAYGTKRGAVALAALESRLGPLPPTWAVSSRDDGISGIRLFRAELPADRRWRDEPGGHGEGIEAIHWGHRYAVTWPSVHPETGAKYTFRGTGGLHVVFDEIPRVDELPELPPEWVELLSEPGEVRTGEQAGHAESRSMIDGWRGGEACTLVRSALARGMAGIAAAVEGDALHPAARDALFSIVSLGHEGHAGVPRALSEHGAAFVEARGGRPGSDVGGDEWWRMVRGAIGKLTGPACERCDCDLWAGDGLDFTGEAVAAWIEVGLSGGAFDPAPVEVVQTLGPAPIEVVDDGSPLAIMRRSAVRAGDMGRRPPPRPLVAGLIYQGALTWLIGKSGSFKSFVALDLAQHVAAGREWGGRRVWGGPVVYLVAEGAGGMSLRVRAWEHVNGPSSDSLIMLPEAVQITGAGWAVFAAFCAEVAPVMIVVDTQARVTVGVNENDNGDMGVVIERIAALGRVTGACVLVVHHIGRNGADARGASAIDGAQDTELRVERKGGPKDLRAVLVMDKQKDSADTGEIAIKARVVDLGIDSYSGEPLSSLVTTPDLFGDPVPAPPWRENIAVNQVIILDVLREMFSEDGGSMAEVRSIVRERGIRDQKWINSQFANAWNRLRSKDLIERVGRSAKYRVVDENATMTIDDVA